MDNDLVSQTFETVRSIARRRGHEPVLQGSSARQRARAYAQAAYAADERRQQDDNLSADVESDEQSTEMQATGSHAVSNKSKPGYQYYRQAGPDGRKRQKPLNLPSAGAVLSDEITQRGWEKNIATGWVTGHWKFLVGEKIAQHTTVEMVKDQALFISCDSTAWATNLKYMQREILKRITEKIGPNIIVELRIFGPQTRSWRKGRLHVKGRGPRDTYG